MISHFPNQSFPAYLSSWFPVGKEAHSTAIWAPETREIPIKRRIYDDDGGCIEINRAEILTGTVHEWLVQPVNSLMSEHIELGKKIIAFVNERIFYSANYPNRRKDSPSLPDLERMLGFIRADGIDLEESLDRAAKLHVGNCVEMAEIGFRYPKTGGVRIEKAEIDNGDHWFLIIGRNLSSDPRMIASWDPETVICDPWASACFPANLHKHLLKDFLYVKMGDSMNPEPVPVVLPFDPATQQIRIIEAKE